MKTNLTFTVSILKYFTASKNVFTVPKYEKIMLSQYLKDKCRNIYKINIAKFNDINNYIAQKIFYKLFTPWTQ